MATKRHDPVDRQVCITCGVDRPAADFWLQASKRNGLFSECKPCMSARNARWHRDNAAERIPKIVANVNRQRRAHPMRGILASAKCRAKKAGMEFSITLDDVPVPEFCPVLGIKMISGMGIGSYPPLDVRDRAPSIDRINNSLGYVPGNVVVVSYRANRIKSNASLEELEAIASFYRKIEDERARESAGGRSVHEIDGLQTDVSTVLANETQEERSLFTRNGAARRSARLLPPLQLGKDLRR